MKKILLLVLALFAVTAKAQTYEFLTFYETGGEETSLPAAGTLITFDAEFLNATTADHVAYTFFLSEMVSMRFSNTATGIESLQSKQKQTNGLVEVFDASGRLLLRYVGMPEDALRSLKAAGVYLIKANGQTQKRFVR